MLPRDFRGFSTKILLAMTVRLPWKPKSLYLPLLGQVVHDPFGTVSTFNEIFFDDVYRPIKPLPSGAQVVDVGAHYGMFAIYAMRKLGASTIHSFEPNPHTFKVLSANIAAADREHAHISLHPAAITIAGGTVQMLIKDNNKTSVDSSIVYRPANLAEPSHLIDVNSVPIADVIKDRCDFMKFDAEGIEYDVLQHEAITPARVSEIVAEIHRVDQQPQRFYELVNTLVRRGYTAYGEDRAKLSAQDIETIGREQSALIMRFA